MGRKLTALLVGVVVAAICVIAVPAQPARAASCSGASCHGKDWAAQGCKSGAYPITGVTLMSPIPNDNGEYKTPVVQLDIWYSPACHAAWGEYLKKSAGTGMTLHSAYYVSPIGGNSKPMQTGKMIHWDNSIKMCATDDESEPDAPGPQGGEGCTPWV